MDVDAVADLYELMSERLLVFFARRTYDGEVALDLTAETFARVLSSRRRFRGRTESEATGWVWGIARNVLSEYFKRGRVERRALRRIGLEPPAINDEEIERIEQLAGVHQLRAAVAEALAGLESGQRQALHLRVVEELEYPLVARRLGVSEATARARVSRGLRRLAGALEGPA